MNEKSDIDVTADSTLESQKVILYFYNNTSDNLEKMNRGPKLPELSQGKTDYPSSRVRRTWGLFQGVPGTLSL
jgi:hypothetical protein